MWSTTIPRYTENQGSKAVKLVLVRLWHERMKHVWISIASIVVLVVLAILVISLMIQSSIVKETGIAVITVILAMAGWIANNIQNRFIQRKQHTLDVLLNSRFSETWNSHRKVVDKYFPPGNYIDPDVVLKEENNEIRESVKVIGNYYEFLAASMRLGDLDEPLLKACVRNQACQFYRRFERYVRRVRYIQNNDNVYADFSALFYRWRREDEVPL